PAKPDEPARRRPKTTSIWSTMADDAREAASQEIVPGEEHRAFYRLSVPKKLAVMFGGPFMNLILAVVILAVVISGIGLPSASTTVASVSECVITHGEDREECAAQDPAAPAFAAGVEPGDVLVSFDGQELTSWEEVSAQIRETPAEPTELVVERDGELQTLSLTPMVTPREVYDAEGELVVDSAGDPVTEDVGFAGITSQTQLQRQSPLEVPALVGDALVRTGQVILTLPQRMVDISKAAFGTGERDPEGPVGVVGVGRFAGEIAAVDLEGYGMVERIADLLGILASLNLALFAFNMIPLLPLDGGHIAGALWEGLRRTVARVRRRPDPGPVDVAKAMPLAYAVFAVVAVMSVLLIYADIVKPITLSG
ncbi:MAG TPA: M50 family metallopeptidase, partial [Actinomycetales bacterium]|nr:M50 family metallopeptidase [Actinomycetales bacterium]